MTTILTAQTGDDFVKNGLPLATIEFLGFARQLGCESMAEQLVELSLKHTLTKFVCGILAFLKEPEVIKIAYLWGKSNDIYSQLAQVGEGVWHNPKLFADLGNVDFSVPVAATYRGHVRECYLSTFLAAAKPAFLDGSIADWIQAFRLWILGVALEANSLGHPNEGHLQKVCTEVRILCDDQTAKEKQSSFSRLASPEVAHTAEGFKASLELSVSRYLSATPESTANDDETFRSSIRVDLCALFNSDFKSLGLPAHITPFRYQRSPPPQEFIPNLKWMDEDQTETTDLDDLVKDFKAGGRNYQCTKSNESDPPESQEKEKDQVLLLSREDGLMLPWSWHRLSDYERIKFFEFISSLNVRPDFEAKLAAGFATVAILVSKSGRQIDELEISDELKDDWTLHPLTFTLSRRPPRRAKGWSPNPRDIAPKLADMWLVKSTEKWSINLDTTLVTSFRNALLKVRVASTMSDLWLAASKKVSFSEWINEALSKEQSLARLTAPILGTVVRQEAFTLGFDHVLARLISSNTHSALPAACAYGAYAGDSVINAYSALNQVLTSEIDSTDRELNWAGSQLEVVENKIVEQLQDLANRTNSAASQPGKWVEYHNLLSTYVVLALLGVTGGRPVNSPFESRKWFDFHRKLVFVDDKSGGMARASRLCILTDEVIELLCSCYFPHLQWLADSLRPTLPEFANQIEAALNGQDSASLPLFFYISNNPSFNWLEISETGLAIQCGGSEWPIPLNFLRHRFSTRLRKLKLDTEIIDALMGHGDAGCETHGAYSLRVLEKDLEAARPLIETLTSDLKLSIPNACPLLITNLNAQIRSNFFGYSRRYGNKARALQRQTDHQHIKEKAIKDIVEALGGREPTTLTSENWDAIGLQMIVNPATNLPLAFGALRYDIFQQYLRTIWKELGIKPKIRRRFLLSRDGSPSVSELSIDAPAHINNLVEIFENICQLIPPHQLRPMLASALAALDACLYSNIADPSVLISIACHSNVVPVYFGGKTYIEHYKSDSWKDGVPVRRFPVSPRCVKWLLMGMSEQKARKKLSACPQILRAIPTAIRLADDVELGTLLRKLAAHVAELNCYRLSGLQAAVLDGRVHVSALPHHDWIRAIKKYSPASAAQAQMVAVDNPEGSNLQPFKRINISVKAAKKSDELALSCKKLFKGVRKALESSQSVIDQCAVIQDLLDKSPFNPGDLTYALGEWGCYLLTRPAHTQSKSLRSSSAETYFNRLAARVSAVAFADQLSEADEDELLELYRRLLQPPQAAPLNDAEALSLTNLPDGKKLASAKAEAATSQSTTEEGDLLAFDQLLDFHEWATQKYGLEEPDFSELGEFSTAPVGRPGMVMKSEYLWCLQQLTGDNPTKHTTDIDLCAAFVMLLAYRFGLRSREAIGIFRRDWVDVGEALVVLVGHNKIRGLKTLQSKRQIPRIETFTLLEKSIVAEVLRRWDAREGKNRDTPLLAQLDATNFKYFALTIRTRLLRILKVATKTTRTTIHHLRHSFACRVLALVDGDDNELGSDANFSAIDIDNARLLLLSHSRIDRRAVWAVCRLMGHSSPATLLKAYFHGQILHRYAAGPQVTNFDEELSDPHLINLDSVPAALDYLTPVANDHLATLIPDDKPATLEMKVNYLRLRGIGFEIYRAAHTVGLGLEAAKHFEKYIMDGIGKLERMHKDERELQSVQDFLEKIAISRWPILLELSKTKAGGDILLAGFEDKVSTEVIGRSRHLVLFRQEHLKAISEFIAALCIRSQDLKIFRTIEMSEYLLKIHKSLGLDRFSKGHPLNKQNASRIDFVTAEVAIGSGQRVKFIERWGVFSQPGKMLNDNWELLLLWMCWACRANE